MTTRCQRRAIAASKARAKARRIERRAAAQRNGIIREIVRANMSDPYRPARSLVASPMARIADKGYKPVRRARETLWNPKGQSTAKALFYGNKYGD